MFDENLGSITNNVGLLSQKDKAMAEYDIHIDFVYYYKERFHEPLLSLRKTPTA
ncbi:MAG: hypothetical protein VB035_12440 [Candidatus Fimivivens sp.]|nr:hypothetical protein [Candidatus Fimivivens sp.]